MRSRSIRVEARKLLALGVPVAITQLGAMTLGVVDTIMVGHVGVLELDASALGNLWIMGTMILGIGTIFGMDPLVSQAHGSGDRRTVALTLQRGIVIALACSLPIGASWFLTGPVLRGLGQDAALADAAHEYVILQVPSLAFFFVFNAVRQWLQGRGIVGPALWVVLLANLFNAGANWVLIFGHLGVPALGLEGAAIATASTRVFQCVGLVLWVRMLRLHRGGWIPWSRQALEPRGLSLMLRLGIPIGIQYGLEVWAFQAATLLAGRLGEVPLAAHVIALNLASLTFMVPLGMSIGTATRVGNLVGAGKRRAAQRAAYVGLGMGAGVMTLAAVAFVTLRHQLPAAFTNDADTRMLAASILPIAAAFQLFDGTQAVGAGVLRGMGATRPAAVINLVGFYVLALPTAWWLGFHMELGVQGVWWGLCVGLASVAAALVLYVRVRGPAHAVALDVTRRDA
jgi:multidrug resistance protein, MATE family